MQIKNINRLGLIIILLGLIIISAGGLLLIKGLNNGKKITIRSLSSQNDAVQKENLNNEEKAVSKEILEEGDPELAYKQESAPQLVESENKKEGKNTETASEKENSVSDFISWGYESSVARKISAVIIHSSYDALGVHPYDFKGLLAEYKKYGVSAHYVIDRKGIIHQLVNDKDIAYHAGKSQLPNGETNVNTISIGIELMNTEKDSYTSEQYKSLKELVAKLKGKYPIKYVLGHKDIASGRKTDPWNFDWNKLQ